jgi:hypothetical protein
MADPTVPGNTSDPLTSVRHLFIDISHVPASPGLRGLFLSHCQAPTLEPKWLQASCEA